VRLAGLDAAGGVGAGHDFLAASMASAIL
jgi:hypothetical protein